MTSTDRSQARGPDHQLRSVNIGYLVVGLVFIGLAGGWLLRETDVIDADGVQWFLPAVLLGAGLIGLFASLGKGLVGSRRKPEPTQYSEDLPVLDLTTDLDRKLAEHETSTETTTDTTTGENR